jgi:sugar phosphate permease
MMVVGLAVLAAGISLFARTPIGGSFTTDVLAASVLAGIGISLTYIPALVTALAGAKPEEAGLTSGLVSTSYQVGSALGLAVMTAAATSATGAGTSLSSLNHGYHAAFLGAAAVAAAAALAALLLIRRQPETANAEAPAGVAAPQPA